MALRLKDDNVVVLTKKPVDILHCPHCQLPMDILKDAGIVVDWCKTCNGLWFDAGEVGMLKEIISSSHGQTKEGLCEGMVGYMLEYTKTSSDAKPKRSIQSMRNRVPVGKHLRKSTGFVSSEETNVEGVMLASLLEGILEIGLDY